LTKFDPISSTRAWLYAAEQSWKDCEVASELMESPTGQAPRSIRLIMESQRFLGQIVLWEDGQSELDMIDMVTDETYTEHRDLAGEEELEEALRTIRDWTVRDTSQ
jgi:hypothetical protein